MTLYLYLSHTGNRYTIDVSEIPSPEILKQWIASNADVPVGRQILMTGAGKNVKQQHLVNDGQIFIYDKKFLLGEEPSEPSGDESTQIPTLGDPPSELENENSLEAWQQLFKSRRAWALEAVELVKNLSEQTTTSWDSCENIDKSANVALDNLKNHINSLRSLFTRTQEWAQETLKEHADMLKEWRSVTKTLEELPIRDDVGHLMEGASSDASQGDVTGTMYTLLDFVALESAEHTLKSSTAAFSTQVEDLNTAMQQLEKDSTTASSTLEIEWPNVENETLVQEAETLVKKIEEDYNDVLRAGSDTRAISKVSRIASNHTSSLLPSLQEVANESIQVHRAVKEHRSTMSKLCFRVLRSISQVQSTLSSLQTRIAALTVDESGQQSLELLDRVFRLPSAYGSILIEAVRRSEWNERAVSDMKNVQDDLSQHKDEEVRRRRKWTNSMSVFLTRDTITSSTAANTVFDCTFSTPSNPWPFVTRQEIFNYVDDLRALQIDDSVEQVSQQLRELDAPTKTRKQRPRPFKNGSVHESMHGSFMRNGNYDSEDLRSLQDDKLRLEDRLRGSESRVRKLEDLLHRQSQSQSSATTRPPSGYFTPIAATDFERQPPSPGPDSQVRNASFDANSLSRRSSVSHQTHARRLSNQNADEKALVQRITTLEAQNATLRIESENNLKSFQEADSVKRDLLANFEAQRQEFDDERQRLEDDNHETKLKLEELEEELDRALGSRDHERMKQEQAASHLRSELERVRRTGNDEMDRLRNARDKLDRDFTTIRDRCESAETQLQQTKAERSSLQDRNLELAKALRKLEEQQADIFSTLQSIHEQLSPAGSAPDEIGRLVRALEVLAEGSNIHARGLDDALQIATAQIKASDERVEELETQLTRTQAAKMKVEATMCDKSEQLTQARHSLDTVRHELEAEHKQVEQLREQFAAGETGSDTLRVRLAEEEKKVARLTELRDKAEVQVEILQQNLTALREDVGHQKSVADTESRRLQNRQKKAKDLSERLFQHNDRMIRLLENFGYSVSRDGDGLSIQRASKVNASQILGDTMLGTPMKRQISGSMPIQHYADPADAQTLYWTHDEDEKIEDAKYESFLKALSRLDLDSTVELITKRYKDVETLAKKYQKDSRLHREKTHRLQSEAHEKIAYRGFKEGDLALFLPTRNQATKPWAAFNVGAPHYFLKETDLHRLQHRDWLLARISKIEERVVDLSRSIANASTKGNADAGASDGASLQSLDDNPFELSDGLRWYLIEATEEKPGAPTTPGLSKSTVAASVIDVNAQLGRKPGLPGGKDSDKATSNAINAAKTLHKSLDSRRSSEASRKSSGMPPFKQSSSGNVGVLAPLTTTGTDGEAEGTMSPAHPAVRPSDADQRQDRAREDDRIFDVPLRPSLNTRVSATSSQNQPVRPSPKKQTSGSKPWDRLFSFEFQA